MQMFLKQSEIEELTGYKRKANQRARLLKMGVPFFINRMGEPVVIRDNLVIVAGAAKSTKAAEPDIEALRALEHGSKA